MPGRLPALRPTRIVRAPEACGLTVMRQTGSHVLLWKPGLLRPVVIAKHNRDLSAATISSILRQADVSAEEFLKHV